MVMLSPRSPERTKPINTSDNEETMKNAYPMRIDPVTLEELNCENQFTGTLDELFNFEPRFTRSIISSSKRQVKMEKGKWWRVRYLPAKLGPKHTFFARIARHWLANQSMICPRQTSQAFGGDPDVFCPVCDLSNLLNNSVNQDERNLGDETRSCPQWLTYCVVFEKDGLEHPMSEVLVPYEHWMYKTTWEELTAFYIAGSQKSPLSVLDYAIGNDFVFSYTSKGFNLDKQDRMPIFDPKDPQYANWIKKIEEHLKNPRVQIPTNEEMQAFAADIQEQVNKLRRSRWIHRKAETAVEQENQPVESARRTVNSIKEKIERIRHENECSEAQEKRVALLCAAIKAEVLKWTMDQAEDDQIPAAESDNLPPDKTADQAPSASMPACLALDLVEQAKAIVEQLPGYEGEPPKGADWDALLNCLMDLARTCYERIALQEWEQRCRSVGNL
jgi:hypothetical protein